MLPPAPWVRRGKQKLITLVLRCHGQFVNNINKRASLDLLSYNKRFLSASPTHKFKSNLSLTRLEETRRHPSLSALSLERTTSLTVACYTHSSLRMFGEICRANVSWCLSFEVSLLGSNLSVDYDEFGTEISAEKNIETLM